MITLGSVIGGPECKFFDSRLRRFMKYCHQNQDKGSKTAEVNIVYHLPGSVLKPDYVGLRTGRFSKKERAIMIQVAVEEEVIASSDNSKIIQYIFETADEALGMAKGQFDKRGIEYDLEADREFLDCWKGAETVN